MATEKVQESLLLKEPMKVAELPHKEVILVEDKSQSKSENIVKEDDEENSMDISMEPSDVISPDNKT
jgi:hypothetical protein